MNESTENFYLAKWIALSLSLLAGVLFVGDVLITTVLIPMMPPVMRGDAPGLALILIFMSTASVLLSIASFLSGLVSILFVRRGKVLNAAVMGLGLCVFAAYQYQDSFCVIPKCVPPVF